MLPTSELPLVGGDLALDFANTAEERGHPEAGEALVEPADLVTWGRRSGVLAADVRPDPGELERATDARELLYELFLARVRGRRPEPRLLAELTLLAAAAYAAGRVETAASGALEWQWDRTDLASVRHRVVIAALDLLASPDSGRLRQCPGHACGWFFLDTSKRGNRRWCSMGECGQDEKNRRRRVG